MAFAAKACVELICDGGCWDQGWDDGVPHFDSESAALEYVLGEDNLGWTERPGGQVLCRACSSTADCIAAGHPWDEWMVHPRDPGIQNRWCGCGIRHEERLTAQDGVT